MLNFPGKTMCLLLLLGCGAFGARAQEARVIAGTVVVDDDLPLDELRVAAGQAATAEVKKTGAFRLEKLPPGVYEVRLLNLPAGYVQVSATADGLNGPFRPGARVTVRVARGGVITGRLTEEDGSPAVLVNVLATLARDAEDKPTLTTFAASAFTDDRGVYRLYGLPSGGYHLAAGGKGPDFWGRVPDSQPLFYYPTGDLLSAAPVAVKLGQEITGVDFSRKRRAGRLVSGFIANPPAELAPSNSPVNVWLVRAGGRIEFSTVPQEKEGRLEFTFEDVIDGEYELIAEMPSNGRQASSTAQHLSVNVANLSGLNISLNLLGEASGRVHHVPDPLAKNFPDCAKQPAPPTWTEFSAFAGNTAANGPEVIILSYFAAEPTARLDERGNFRLRGLRPGSYRLRFGFPGPNWYVRSLNAPGNPPQDIGARGFTIKGGKTLEGVEVVVDNSAATLQGRVTLPEGKTAGQLWAYLLPAEPEQAENLLRYAETPVRRDGMFVFTNLAPGRYRLAVIAEDRLATKQRPAYWQVAARQQMRQAVAGQEFVLPPCQQVKDAQIKFVP
jgi:hypothetical protein